MPSATTPSRPSNSQPTTSMPTFDPQAEANRLAEEERQRSESSEGRVRSAINQAYEPIFAELDRQIGIVPEQKGALETQVGSLATSQRTDVGEQETQRTGELETTKGTEIERGKSALRDLDQNIRNALLSKSFYFGSLGAGDSSATGQASEAVTRAGLRARGGILEVRNTALTELDSKIQQVKDTSQTQLRKIDEWRSTKLFEVGQWAFDRINTLNSEKATAQGRRGEAIANLIQNTESDFIARLRQLDDAVFNYKSTVQQWQDKRAGELEDFKTKLSISSQYTSGTASKYTIKMDQFGRVIAVNPTNPQDYQVLPTGIISPESLGAFSNEDEEENQPSTLGQFLGVGQ